MWPWPAHWTVAAFVAERRRLSSIAPSGGLARERNVYTSPTLAMPRRRDYRWLSGEIRRRAGRGPARAEQREEGLSRRSIVVVALCLLASGLLALPASAEETVTITKAAFTPNKLGSPTNASGAATIGSTTGPVPSPIRHVDVFGPAGVTLDLQGTGVCQQVKLEQFGAKGCPADSRAGFGGGMGIYELGHELVEEEYTLDFFLADNRPGHVALFVFLSGHSPVVIEMILHATVIQGPKPYGLGFSVEVPAIKVLPEASNASARTAFLTLGAKNVSYFKTINGKRRLFHVRGIVLPKKCPKGGWPVASQFTFEDGSTLTAKRTVPCPKG